MMSKTKGVMYCCKCALMQTFDDPSELVMPCPNCGHDAYCTDFKCLRFNKMGLP